MQLVRTLARTVLPVAFAAFIAAGCGGENGVLGIGGIPKDAVCTVDGTAIKRAEFERMFGNAQQQYKDNGKDFPKKGSDEYKALQSDLIDYLVQQELIKGQAEKLGVKASDKEITKGVKDLKQQVAGGDEKKFKKEMKRVNYTMELVERDVRFDIVSRKVYKEIVADIKVSDKEAKDYFTEHPDQYVTKESRDVAHILVKDKAKADELYAQVKDADEATFAKLAKANSQDPGSKDTGGVLKDVQRGQTVPEFDKVAFELKVGEVAKPVKSSYGWHIIAARSEIKPETKKKYADVKDEVKQTLRGQQEGEHYQEWNTDVRKDAEDSVDCRKGYVWKQTVKETDTNSQPPAATPAEDQKSKDEKSKDKKAKDTKAKDTKAKDTKAKDAKAEDTKAKDDAGK